MKIVKIFEAGTQQTNKFSSVNSKDLTLKQIDPKFWCTLNFALILKGNSSGIVKGTVPRPGGSSAILSHVHLGSGGNFGARHNICSPHIQIGEKLIFFKLEKLSQISLVLEGHP